MFFKFFPGHAQLKAEKKNLYLSSVKSQREKLESKISNNNTNREETSTVPSPTPMIKEETPPIIPVFGKPQGDCILIPSRELMSSQPFFVSHGLTYCVMLKHILASQCYLEFDVDKKIVIFRVVHLTYLFPKEFKKTKFWTDVNPTWNGKFDNFGTETKAFVSRHPFQLPSDTNMEAVNIKRYDVQTCTSWLVEVHFQKSLAVANHLMPNASMWGLLEEGIKEGKGQDEVFQQETGQPGQPQGQQ
jgi:hypothetical protein